MSHLPVVMTIAGSDSGGGAGIQADLKTFQAFGCFGVSAITAITCQNTRGVSAVQGIDPKIVTGQIKDVIADLPVQAAKTGMLFSTEIIRSVQKEWERHKSIPLVVDPVMVASSGDRLLEKSAEEALIEFLKSATIITPNLPEAEVILNQIIEDFSQMEKAAQALHKATGASVLLKGGHRLRRGVSRTEVVDVFYNGSTFKYLRNPILPERNTHGTGCTLSAAIAAGLAKGKEEWDAIQEAREFLQGALKHAPGIGSGHGPLNHMWKSHPK